MIPRLSQNNKADIALCGCKNPSNIFLSNTPRGKLPYIPYIFLSQFRRASIFAPANQIRPFSKNVLVSALVCASSFFGSVFVVVIGCAKKQMVWIHTLFVVAFVAYKKAIRNISIVNNPRGSVRPDVFPIYKKPAITVGGELPAPFPAPIRHFVNVAPKGVYLFGAQCHGVFPHLLSAAARACSVVRALLLPRPALPPLWDIERCDVSLNNSSKVSLGIPSHLASLNNLLSVFVLFFIQPIYRNGLGIVNQESGVGY
jgi:hypothetical protein